MNFKMIHLNFNVFNLEKSLKFYQEVLGLKEKRRITAEDGSFIIVYVGNDLSEFELELTWLASQTIPYDLGDEEFHLACEVDDYKATLKTHQDLGIVAMINEKMGIYFITDPDGYWIEILPRKKQR